MDKPKTPKSVQKVEKYTTKNHALAGWWPRCSKWRWSGGRVARSGGGLVPALLEVAVVWWPRCSKWRWSGGREAQSGGGLVAVLLEGAAVWWPCGSKWRWFGGRVALLVTWVGYV